MVIQGHAFWDQWKAAEGLHIAIMYNNVGVISKSSKDIASRAFTSGLSLAEGISDANCMLLGCVQ